MSPLYDDVTLFFVRSLASELAPVRKIAIAAVGKALAVHVAAVRGGVIAEKVSATAIHSTQSDSGVSSLTPIESEAEWLATPFTDFLFSGWPVEDSNSIRLTYTKRSDTDSFYAFRYSRDSPIFPRNYYAESAETSSAPLPLSAAVLHEMRSVLEKHMPAVIAGLVHNHPTLAAANEGDSGSRGSSGAGDTIAGLAYSHFPANRFPLSTRFSHASAAFDHEHVLLVRGWIEVWPQLATEEQSPLLVALREQVKASSEQDQQCTAAEVIAGIIHGCKHATMDVQRRMQAHVLPLVLSMIAGAQQDVLPHLTDCLRAAYTNSDPRRLVWLSRALVQHAFRALPGTATEGVPAAENESPAQQQKRFRLLLPLLIEGGWRCRSLGRWMLERFEADGWLTHPYRQCREEVGWLLFFITRNAFNAHKQTNGSYQLQQADEIKRFISNMQAELERSMPALNKTSDGAVNGSAAAAVTIAAESSDVNGSSSKSDDAVSAEEHAKRILQTLLSFLMTCYQAGDLIYTSAVFQALLPHVIRGQHTTDLECAKMARSVAHRSAWLAIRGPAFTADGSVLNDDLSAELPLLSAVLQSVSGVATNARSSWQVRVSALRFLQVFVPRHSLLLTSSQVNDLEILLSEKMLPDPHTEVREATAVTLAALLASCLAHPAVAAPGFSASHAVSQHVQRLQKQLQKLAKTPLPAKGAAASELSSVQAPKAWRCARFSCADSRSSLRSPSAHSCAAALAGTERKRSCERHWRSGSQAVC